MYLAALPLIFPAYFVVHAIASHFSGSKTSDAVALSNLCVATYGASLSDSQVLTGTARNSCENPVKDVHLTVSVIDDKGNRRVESIDVPELEGGATQRFERVLSGRVKSWEIASDK